MNSTGPIVTVIRHGATIWSATGQHTGCTDLELTSEGEDQARAVGLLAARYGPFELVLCSPLRRTRRTAELAGLEPAEVVEDLREWDYGDLEGLTTDEIRADLPGWPGGETAVAVATRADRVLARIMAEPPSARVAVVAHGHILRVLAARWIEADVTEGRRLALDTATIGRLGWEHGYRVVRSWNAPAT